MSNQHNNTARYTRLTRLIAAAALACAATAPALAGDFMVRARALYLEPANEGTSTAAGVSANSKYIWEVDASYFLTPSVAVELIATSPQRHTVALNGSPLGTLRHLPPTLTVQYHFAPTNPTVRPYVGLGVNYTRFSAVKLANGAVTIDKSSRGPAFQIGADFPITQNISFNVDFKKINIRTEAKLNGAAIGTIKIDPTVFGIGIGYRF